MLAARPHGADRRERPKRSFVGGGLAHHRLRLQVADTGARFSEAGTLNFAVKMPWLDGRTVATIVPVAIVAHDADTRMITGLTGLSRGGTTLLAVVSSGRSEAVPFRSIRLRACQGVRSHLRI